MSIQTQNTASRYVSVNDASKYQPLAHRNPTVLMVAFWALVTVTMVGAPIVAMHKFLTMNTNPMHVGGFLILGLVFTGSLWAAKRIWI